MPVREATPADLDDICDLIQEHATYEGNQTLTLNRADMAEHLFGPQPWAAVLIAEPPDRPGTTAGFALWHNTFSTWAAQPGIWLDDLFVRAGYRGYGLGRELLAELRCRTDGRVEWEVRWGNTSAEGFYRSLGAHPVDGWTRYRWNVPAG
ncbi:MULTISPECIES: GNAT family N-acetyltransferase [unclassified Crossiella]|uniref:GNAT family N-acetyltransferase n=1 Tax=unclassified Crossiella TaxID=2620835 RepID=UPI001FFEBF10|nr:MULTISPECIES: GNAT family N-acetyltransferase [unclassified Crossiella]MCK2239873.1 GNAT family N-acetyltransferase [Crossiella sp. S99.2]MCK2252581.1 GNAT family N-acetyltransferase [Crossiella sp. S99.1]